MGAWYTTREAVKADLDFKETARANEIVDRAIAGGARSIEGITHRSHFYPLVATRKFDWPNDAPSGARSYQLFLSEHRLISVSSLSSGGAAISASDFFLYPDDGPPYSNLQLDRSSNASFGGGSGPQRDVVVAGVWGESNETEAAGALALAANASVATLDATDSSAMGVGSIITIGTERMIVRGKSMVDTGQNLGSNLAESVSAESVAVQSGAAFTEGEVIMVDAEKMLVVEIAGNTLVVKRKWDGSTLAAHTAPADVYAPRRLRVERGALGTTAAEHLLAATVSVWVVPELLEELNAAEAINTILQKRSGYVQVAGGGENAREARALALENLRERVIERYGRPIRQGAV